MPGLECKVLGLEFGAWVFGLCLWGLDFGVRGPRLVFEACGFGFGFMVTGLAADGYDAGLVFKALGLQFEV